MTQSIPIEMTQTVMITTSAGGVINTVIASALSNFLSYSSAAALFDEFRMLSCICSYTPSVENAVINLVSYTPCVSVVDRDSATALTSYAGGMDAESAHSFALNKRDVQIYRMNGSGLGESTFTSSAIQNFIWIKYYSSSLTGTTNYGQATMRALFQFRGRV